MSSMLDALVESRGERIARLSADMNIKLSAQMSFRRAVREIAKENDLPVLAVRRLLREHPAAPLP